jgi:hypothetical protein
MLYKCCVISKSLQDFWPLRYSSWDGHAKGGSMSTEGEALQVSVVPCRCLICPPLVAVRAPDRWFSQMLDSLGQWPRLAYSFHSAQAATLLEFHVPFMNCFVHRWFCVLHGPKPLLHCHNWLSFGKFQDKECFLISCPCHVSSWLPPSSETCKYTAAPSIQKKTLERFSTYWYAPLCCVCLGRCTAEFGNSRGTYQLPCTLWKISNAAKQNSVVSFC